MIEFFSSSGEYRYSVTLEFLTICPFPERATDRELFCTYSITKYLHNPHGPAFVHIPTGYEEYWKNGQELSDAARERAQEIYLANCKIERAI